MGRMQESKYALCQKILSKVLSLEKQWLHLWTLPPRSRIRTGKVISQTCILHRLRQFSPTWLIFLKWNHFFPFKICLWAIKDWRVNSPMQPQKTAKAYYYWARRGDGGSDLNPVGQLATLSLPMAWILTSIQTLDWSLCTVEPSKTLSQGWDSADYLSLITDHLKRGSLEWALQGGMLHSLVMSESQGTQELSPWQQANKSLRQCTHSLTKTWFC